jgi:hypothetical protein
VSDIRFLVRFARAGVLALAIGVFAPSVLAQVDASELAADAPQEYAVVKGDTLWDISGRFLKSPWKWPKIWKINAERIKNPHWIYPGDLIFLIGDGNGNFTLSLGRPIANAGGALQPRVRDEGPVTWDGRSAISTIPAELLRPFINRPMLVPAAEAGRSPVIVAAEEGRMNVGSGGRAYVEGLDSQPGARFSVWRQGTPIVDPQTGEVLAVEAIDVGVAEVVRSGSPATILIRSSRQEIGRGDRLVAFHEERIFSYVPSSPERNFSGRLIRVYDDRSGSAWAGGERRRAYMAEGGARSIVLINRGTTHGIQPGSVISLGRSGGQIENRSNAGWKLGERVPAPVNVPDEIYGKALVFKVFDKLSYAIVLSSSKSVNAGDSISSPD